MRGIGDEGQEYDGPVVGTVDGRCEGAGEWTKEDGQGEFGLKAGDKSCGVMGC